MQANNKDTVTFSGVAKIESRMFNDCTAEITIYNGVTYRTVKYNRPFLKSLSNFPILRLSIERVHGEITTEDEYPYGIPYLKGIPDFRILIADTLRMHFARCRAHPLFIDGVREYLRELRGYSDVKGLVRQAKSAANLIRPDHRDAERQARGVLKALGRTPGCDIQIEFRDR